MIFIHTLRMVVDLSFYFFFAEFVVTFFGGNSMLIEMLLLCLIYGFLIHIQKSSQNRLFLLLPALVLFMPKVMGFTMANRIALIPAIIYIIYVITKEIYGLSWDRQVELFSVSWKVFLGIGLCICLAGKYDVFLSRSTPVAFISLVTSIMLLRMLRHDPEVYLSPQYQFKNLLLLGGLLVTAWLSSRDFVFHGLGTMLGAIYENLILPILSFFIACFVAILNLIMKLFSWLKLGSFEVQESAPGSSAGVNPFSNLDPSLTQNGVMFEKVLTALIILILIVIAFFVFRWLIGNWEADPAGARGFDVTKTTEPDVRRKGYASSTVLQVRKQYRKFLKLYQAYGGKIQTSNTSEDIAKRGSELFPSPDIIEEMRQIYIRARYNQTATRADLKRIKQINQLLKQ